MVESGYNKLTVLIVDDSEENLKIYASFIRNLNCNFCLARNATEALESFDKYNIDAVILDIMLPGMDGFEICLRIRENLNLKNIPVIFISARNDAASIEKSFEVGGTDYMVKPCNPRIMQARLRSHLAAAQATRKMAESEYRLSLTLDSITDIVIAVDVDGRIEMINSIGCQMLGMEMDQIIGQHFEAVVRLIDTSHHEKIESPVLKVFSTGKVLRLEHEVTLISSDDSEYHVMLSAYPSVNPGSECVVGVVLVFRDITDEYMHHELHERAEFALEYLPGEVYFINQDGRFIYMNKMARETFGFTKDSFSDKYIFDVNPILKKDGWNDHWIQEFKKPVSRRESVHIDADGIEYPVELFVRSITLNGFDYMCVFASDLTRKKKQEQELIAAREEAEAASRAKSQFLSNMSHEIRTPLNAIIGFSEFLADDVTPDQKEMLDGILVAGNSLLELISDVLDIAMIEAGRVEINPAPSSLTEVCHEMEVIFKMRAAEKDIALKILPPELNCKLLLDETKIRQITMNLLGNAIKFTDEGTVSLGIDVEKVNSEHCNVAITCKDTGCGIKPENLERIFNIFEQGEHPNTKTHEGTGLGLAICKRLVSLMDGMIDVESVPEVGSTFRVYIPNVPVVQDDVPQYSYSSDEFHLSQLPSEALLIAENNLLPLLEEQHGSIVIGEISHLAEVIKDLGDKFGLEDYKNIAEELEKAAHSFDIINMEAIIKLLIDQINE